MRKGQITIYVIIGLLIIVVLSSFFIIRESAQKTVLSGNEYVFEMGPKQSSLESVISECVKQNVIQGEILFGLRRDWSPQYIERHIKKELPACIDSFAKEQKYKTNYGELDVKVEIDQEALMAYINYPMEFEKQDTLLRFEDKEFRFPRTVMETIDPEKTTRIVSADGTMILEIPLGTVATLDGKQIDKVGLKQLDREFNGLSNSVVAGNLAFNGIPHGTVFSKPVKVTKYYRDVEIPIGIKEEDVRIMYFNDNLKSWLGYPTEVDPIKNKLVISDIRHFSVLASGIGCDGKERSITFITDNLISHQCGPCNAEWASVLPDDVTLGVGAKDNEKSYSLSSCMISGGFGCSKDCLEQEHHEPVPENTGYTSLSSLIRCEKAGHEYDSSLRDCVDYYFGYENENIDALGSGTMFFEGDGNTCFGLEETDTEVIPTVVGKPEGNSKIEISVNTCSPGDNCQIFNEKVIFTTSVDEFQSYLFFSFYGNNFGIEDMCLYGTARIDFTGIGVTSEGAEIRCDSEGKNNYVGFTSGDPSDVVCQTCKCEETTINGEYGSYVSKKCVWEPSLDSECNKITGEESICVDALIDCVRVEKGKCYICQNNEWIETSDGECSECKASKTLDDTPSGGVVMQFTGNAIKSITGWDVSENDNSEPKRCVESPYSSGNSQQTCEEDPDCPLGQFCEEGICTPELGGGERPEECEAISVEACPDFDIDEFKDTIIKTDKTLDTRDKGFCDTFGDLPSGTSVMIKDSAMKGTACWIFVKSQQDFDGYKPDLYISYDAIKHLLNETTEGCDSDEDCKEGFYCDLEEKICKDEDEIITVNPIVGYYDFDFADEILFEPLSLGYYTEDNDVITNNDYTWFVKLNYDDDLDLSEVIEEDEDILGYWLIDTDCSEDYELNETYKEYHNITSIPLITKMTKECVESWLDKNTSFTDIVFFEYDGDDSILDLDTELSFIPMINVSEKTAQEIIDLSDNILDKDYSGFIFYTYADVIKDEYDYINAYSEAFCKANEEYNDVDCEYTDELPDEVKIAFIANQGYDENAQNVIDLINREEADLVVLNGNLGYVSYDDWRDIITSLDMAYIASRGVNDSDEWSDYEPFHERQFSSDVSCTGITSDKMTCVFKDIVFTVSGVGSSYETLNHVDFITNSLDNENDWNFCVWNKANKDLRISNKEDVDTLYLDPYNACKDKGAIIITGYDEAYARTKLLNNLDPITTEDNYELEPGKTIVFMSGLGGYDNETYSCNNHDTDSWWSSIFTNNYYLNNGVEIIKDCEDAANTDFNYGALFITINPDGNENTAKAEFITIDDSVIDSVEVNLIN